MVTCFSLQDNLDVFGSEPPEPPLDSLYSLARAIVQEVWSAQYVFHGVCVCRVHWKQQYRWTQLNWKLLIEVMYRHEIY